MRLNRSLFAALLLSGAVAVAFNPAAAATRSGTNFGVGTVDATAGSTFATTSYADLPGATVTLTPQVDPNATEAPGVNKPTDTIIVEFNADVTKATATTGTCAVYANGAVVAKTARTISSAAGQGTMTIFAALANTTTGAQTVKVQCKSGDTNVFTVNNAMLRVIEAF
jgi:hypothetical protein